MDSGFQFFFGFNAFLCISFSCSNLAILKDVVTMHNKFVFDSFSICIYIRRS